MLDFPASPTSGQLYNASNGVVYQWVSSPAIWVAQGSWTPPPPTHTEIDVISFGATGNGVTDDTKAIQNAIDYVFNHGGGIVTFPKGQYSVSLTSLTENFLNADVVITPAQYAIVLRTGVSLIGQADRSAVIFQPASSPSIITIMPVDPVGCRIEGFEIHTTHTMAAARATQGIMTVSSATAVEATRKCQDNTFRNLYIHSIGGYGIGLQNASPVRCRIEDCDFWNIGSASIDLKARMTLSVPPVGNYIDNVTSRDHGNRLDDAAIDIRGVWHLSNITVTEFGNKAGQPGYGIRFRQCPDAQNNVHQDWVKAAQYSTLTNFYIKPTTGGPVVTYGVFMASDDVHVSNGTVEGCTYNFAVISSTVTITAASWSAGVATLTVSTDPALIPGYTFTVRGMTPTGYNGVSLVAAAGTTGTTIKYNVAVDPGAATTMGYLFVANALPTGVTLTNVTSKSALTYGCHIQLDAEQTALIGYTSYSSGTAGVRNEGNNTQIMGMSSISDATPMTVLAAAAPTMFLFNGPSAGSVTLGGGMAVAQRILINTPIVGGANAYAAQVTSDVGAGVTNAYGYATSLAAPAGISTNFRHFFANQGTVAGTLTNQYGFYAQNTMTAGGTTNIGFYGNLAVAATAWNVRCDGSAQNYFGGLTGFGGGIITPTASVHIKASTTAAASLRIVHGVAPTTPNDGDMWTTTAGLFVRINGVTVGPLT